MTPRDLGRVMEIICSCYPSYMMENIVFSSLPMFATYGTGVRFRESSNEVNACTQQCNVVGPFGSGKGGVAHLYEWLMAPLLAQNAASMDEEFDAWVEAQKSSQSGKKGEEGNSGKVVHEKGKAPRIVGPNISYLQLLLRMKEAKGEHLLMFTEEIVELVNNSQLSYGKLGPVLTHAFDRDGGVCTNQSASSASPNLSVKALLNTLLIGQDEYFMKFFKDWKTGKFSRQLVTFTQSRLGEKKPRYLHPSTEQMQEIRTCIERLQQEVDTEPLHVPEIEKCIDEWYDEMNCDYRAGLIDDARLQLTYRCGLMGKRAAYLMYVMSGKVMSPCILNVARYVTERNLDNLYSLAAHEMNQKSEIREQMKRNISLLTERTQKLLDKLKECGEMFDTTQFDDVNNALGIWGDRNSRTVARSRLVKKQLITKVDAHHWRVN